MGKKGLWISIAIIGLLCLLFLLRRSPGSLFALNERIYDLQINESLDLPSGKTEQREYRYTLRLQPQAEDQKEWILEVATPEGKAANNGYLVRFNENGLISDFRSLSQGTVEEDYAMRIVIEALQFPRDKPETLERSEPGINGAYKASYQKVADKTWQKTKSQSLQPAPTLSLQMQGEFRYSFDSSWDSIQGQQTTSLKDADHPAQKSSFNFHLASSKKSWSFPIAKKEQFASIRPRSLTESSIAARPNLPDGYNLDSFLAHTDLQDQKIQTDELTNLENLLRSNPLLGDEFVTKALALDADDLRFQMIALALARSPQNQRDFGKLVSEARNEAQTAKLCLYINDAVAPTTGLIKKTWELAASKDEQIRTRASLAVGTLAQHSADINEKLAILGELKDRYTSEKDSFQRSVWMAALGNSADPAAFEMIRDATKDEDVAVRLAAINGLRHFPAEKSFETLLSFVKTEKVDEALVAVKVLAPMDLNEEQRIDLKAARDSVKNEKIKAHLNDIIKEK